MKLKNRMKTYGLRVLGAGLMAAPLLAHADGDPSADVITAMTGAQTSATLVIGAGGGIIVILAIAAGLWRLGARWSGKAASGGK